MSQPGRPDEHGPNTVSSTTTTHGPTTATTTTHGPTIATTTYAGNGPRTTVTTSAPHAPTIVSPTVTTTHQVSFLQPPRSSAGPRTEQQPSIRLRRSAADLNLQDDDGDTQGNRRRSLSEPERPQAALLKEAEEMQIRRHASATPLQTLHEEGSGYSVPQVGYYTPVAPGKSAPRPAFGRQVSAFSLRHARNFPAGNYDADVVDVLDVIGMHIGKPRVACANVLHRPRSVNAHDLE